MKKSFSEVCPLTGLVRVVCVSRCSLLNVFNVVGYILAEDDVLKIHRTEKPLLYFV